MRFLQRLQCWVRGKTWVSLVFGEWKTPALGQLAGVFMLTLLVCRSDEKSETCKN